MDQIEFIKSIKEVVTESTTHSIEEAITNPPGKVVEETLIDLAKWFRSLSEKEKNMIRMIIKYSADDAVFGFLCVLDGVRAIEDSYYKGKLLLFYERKDERVLINNPDQEELHNIYNGLE